MTAVISPVLLTVALLYFSVPSLRQWLRNLVRGLGNHNNGHSKPSQPSEGKHDLTKQKPLQSLESVGGPSAVSPSRPSKLSSILPREVPSEPEKSVEPSPEPVAQGDLGIHFQTSEKPVASTRGADVLASFMDQASAFPVVSPIRVSPVPPTGSGTSGLQTILDDSTVGNQPVADKEGAEHKLESVTPERTGVGRGRFEGKVPATVPRSQQRVVARESKPSDSKPAAKHAETEEKVVPPMSKLTGKEGGIREAGSSSAQVKGPAPAGRKRNKGRGKK
eukprot:TRINITY_DN80041_c0_g1_i1.p1 TRINITY_DN80041_c0_g1~~TRINITY_DN80041_c0_g1_i1.p1  ORF type:complete len:277 (-),score=20.16 TRINITY_DN80041_c0_g1_i1:146-976(-)